MRIDISFFLLFKNIIFNSFKFPKAPVISTSYFTTPDSVIKSRKPIKYFLSRFTEKNWALKKMEGINRVKYLVLTI